MSLFKKHQFLVRKLHSFLGLFPIGVFLIEHLITNSFAKQGAGIYNEKIEWIQGMPYLFAMEIGFIFVPLLLHVLLGFIYLWGWKDNLAQYRYPRNFLYTFQRISGIAAFVFIGYHVWTFRIATALYDTLVNFDLVAQAMLSPWILIFYVIGIASIVFHFANGIWNFLVHWGMTTGPRSQRISGVVCAGVGLILLYVGLDALFAFVK